MNDTLILQKEFTLNNWLTYIQNECGFGSSSNDDYPLSSYLPISKQQIEIIKNYYLRLSKNKMSYDMLLSKIEDLTTDLYSLEDNKGYTFLEKYPSVALFRQAIANTSGFLYDNTLEIYPNKTYYMAFESQKKLIDDTYDILSKNDKSYSETKFLSLTSNIVLLSPIPLDLLPVIKYDM